MTLSVVICTHDRASILGACLDALARQDCDADVMEVIVVDSASTDSTPAVVESRRPFPFR
jgi:glycosyltransferase involved in cell wall biosynthesis